MHIETLKVFCDLVDMQSFSLAAERNFITQSAVSQQIRTLEEKFKRRLLERVRGRREIRLTPAGEVFYRRNAEFSPGKVFLINTSKLLSHCLLQLKRMKMS